MEKYALSAISGNPEEDERELLRSLERNLTSMSNVADQEIRRLNGKDEPLRDSDGTVTQASTITFWRATKEWLVVTLPQIRLNRFLHDILHHSNHHE